MTYQQPPTFKWPRWSAHFEIDRTGGVEFFFSVAGKKGVSVAEVLRDIRDNAWKVATIAAMPTRKLAECLQISPRTLENLIQGRVCGIEVKFRLWRLMNWLNEVHEEVNNAASNDKPLTRKKGFLDE